MPVESQAEQRTEKWFTLIVSRFDYSSEQHLGKYGHFVEIISENISSKLSCNHYEIQQFSDVARIWREERHKTTWRL